MRCPDFELAQLVPVLADLDPAGVRPGLQELELGGLPVFELLLLPLEMALPDFLVMQVDRIFDDLVAGVDALVPGRVDVGQLPLDGGDRELPRA